MKGYIFLTVVLLLHHIVFCISSHLDNVPLLTEEHLNWSAYNGNSTQVKNEHKENRRPGQKPIASSIYVRQTNPQPINNENNSALLWDGEHCPQKTTGLFPVQSDCRKFLNCFKGRGFVQSCAPGTLFNPNSLECDYPAKVQCVDGNPSKIDSSFINRNPGQHFDLNAQTSNQDRVFVSNTNQYQQQSTNQYQPQSLNQFQPRPLIGSQFIVERQNSNTDSYSQNIDSSAPVDYGLQAGGSKPLYGSNFVTNGYSQSNAKLQPQQFFPPDQNNKLEPQITPNGQVFNPRLQKNLEPLNVNVKYPGTNQQQFPVRQNINQNPTRVNIQGYVSPSQENIPLLNEQSNVGGSQFLLEPDNYGMPSNHDNIQEIQNSQLLPDQNNYGNVQYTQNTYLKEKEPSQQKNPIRFPYKNENLPTGFNGYSNGNPNSNPSNINPSSWMKGQLKGKQMAGQSSYTNGYTNEQTVGSEFQAPNSHLNKPASTFDLGNREQIEHSKQTPIQNNYDSLSVPIQSPVNYDQQVSIFNDQNYNINSSPSYSPLSKFNHPAQQQNSYSSSQDRQINRDSKTNKQFRIVVPEMSHHINNGEQHTNPTIEFNSNRGSSSKQLNSYNNAQYPNTNGNFGTKKNPSYSDNGQSPQNSPAYTQPATSSKCPNGFNGIKPHPTDCSKFLSCANGRTFEMDCGPGTLFNPTLSVCDHPYNVECNRNNVPSILPSPTEESTLQTTVEDYYTTTTAYDDYTTPIEDYNTSIDKRLGFDHETSNSDLVTETAEPLENHNQAVFETLPTENRQFKILKNPSSIDLPDNFLSNSSITQTPSKVLNDKLDNVAVRIDLKPNSTQTIRLRGGPKNSEGFLQVQEKPFQWGVVCDAPNSWNIEKADIVCKQLGFNRGAEQTWQGLTVATDNPARLFRNIGVTKVSCNGQESVLHNCKLQNDKSCTVERDAVWVKCRTNSGSECQPEEVSYSGKCYKLFTPVPEKQSKSIQDIGYSKAEALEHCQKRGGKLLGINSQKENDFISEWLSRQKTEGPVMTSGVGLSLLNSPIWLWEGTEDPFVYYNWWPGWEFKKPTSPGIKTNRALCVVLQKSFPCPSNPNSTKLCDSEYYFWEAIDCGTKTDHLPYVCERNVDDIGCVNGVGSDYIGSANTTASGNACLSWEDQSVLIAMKYRVSEKTRRSLLTKHNKCRNPDGTDLQPWCYVQTSTGIVRSEFCDISVCNAAKKSFRASSLVEKPKCDTGYFECQPNECITQAWVCDNQADCSNGMDEKNCSNILESFIKTPEARLTNREVEKWLHTSVHTCANRCKQADGFVCQSFSHNEIEQTCILNERTKYDNSTILESDKSWDYYEIDNALCIGKFICENGNCVDKSKECDGHNDCGDRSDETTCTKSMMGYEIRLVDGNSTNEGRIEVKVLGEWGVICDDKFDLREANVVCRELGFLGSVAVKPNSFYGVPNKTRFVLDDLDCNGNEDSLYSCKFKEWGVHDCNAQESAGVVCRVPGGKACSNEEFECKSGECVPVRFLCDSYADCTDGSDESPEHCNVSVSTTSKFTTTSTTTKAPKKYVQKIAPKKKEYSNDNKH